MWGLPTPETINAGNPTTPEGDKPPQVPAKCAESIYVIVADIKVDWLFYMQ